MHYCNNCILPDTRPNLKFNAEGVCNACEAHSTKADINWEKREKLFANVVKHAKTNSSGYDCLIPVSGGKDSTWQVVKCLEYGLTPLCVTWRTPARTEIGTKNLDNLVSLGVDHIDYQISPIVEKIFMWEAYEKFGATAVPMHMAIFNIPIKIAMSFDIPLIIWGENSAFEYGGSEEERTGFKLDSNWFKNFGVTHGTTAQDWISDKLTKKTLTPYFGPSYKELDAKGILAVFLGYYFSWDPIQTFKIAKDNGFKNNESGPKTGVYNFADIDCNFISVHHYLKWYKFGITRAFDNLSIDIRNGRITRDDAIKTLKKIGDECPKEDINLFCDFVGKTEDDFFEICEKFRNHKIWNKENGVWKIDDFLIEDWNWK